MKEIKEEKGITLVALVITIIILIILATIAINFAFGDNGLINRAEQAKDFYANDTQYTDESVTNIESYLDGIIDGTIGSGDDEDGGGDGEETNPPETPDIPGGEDAIAKGAITFTNPTWSGGKASVTISTNTSYTLQYQVVANEGASIDTNWQAVPQGGVIGNLNHKDIVYARLIQDNHYGEEASATVKDENEPQGATINLSSTSVTVGSNVTATVTHRDNESGPNIEQCKYIWNTSNVKLGIDASLYTGGTFSSNGEQISTSFSSPATYYLHVLTVDNAGNGTETVSNGVTIQKAEISDSTSYVGYYADVDGNGSVDGVIYADLAIGGTGQWGNVDGKYTIPKGSNFKKYGISKTNHNDDFETADVIKVTNSSGNERFYVMALDDFDTGLHYWYYDAYGNMNDYASCTSMAFGSGEQNTRNMITKWNASEYGEQNAGDYTDLWGLDAIQSGTWNGSTGWYVPSAGEWAAFAGNLEIYTYNYKDKGLSDDYVSSSQASHTYIWNPQFFTGYVMTKHVRGKIPVRLGTTF